MLNSPSYNSTGKTTKQKKKTAKRNPKVKRKPLKASTALYLRKWPVLTHTPIQNCFMNTIPAMKVWPFINPTRGQF
jgi:hypothetical protein